VELSVLNGGKKLAGDGSGTGISLSMRHEKYSISTGGGASIAFASESLGTGQEVNIAARRRMILSMLSFDLPI
jgi:hypothetical protein